MSSIIQITPLTHFNQWLAAQKISLAFTTYQTNRLFLIGLKPDGRLSVFDREFDRPMGLFATPECLVMSTCYQIWQFDNLCREEVGDYLEYDKLYVPRIGYTTGDINTHDLIVDKSQNWVFVNTQFSCLATRDRDYSFRPIWQPPFISSLAAEDRCHLNGLAMVEGEPTYVTACSQTDIPAGWRSHRQGGGCIIDIRSNEIICSGLTMPHSPRFYQNKLWVLNSGTGELGYVENGQFQAIAFCPGFVRGLAFHNNYAIVGLSKPRHENFQGLTLSDRLSAQQQQPQCGLMVVDLNTGNIVHSLIFEEVVKELFDIAVLPRVRQPMALGFQTDEIERLVTFPGSSIISIRPGIHQPPETSVKVSESVVPAVIGTEKLETAAAAFDRGRDLQKQRKLEEAAAYFREAISLDRNYIPAYNNLGNLLQLQGKIPEAIALLQRAIEINPNLAATRCNLASAYLLQGNIAAAKAGYEETLRLDPNFYLAYLNLGKLHASRQETVIAEGYLREVLRLKPDNAEARNALARLTYSLSSQAEKKQYPQTLPKVSLIMTAYNTAAYIEQAIASVLAQTYQDWELIIWDDGSSDETASIARFHAERDSRIRLYSEPHQGYSHALNSSFALARATYFGCVDSDDILVPSALEETVAVLDANLDLGVVYTNHVDIDSQGNQLGLNYRCQIPYSPERLLVDFMTFHFRLMRRQVFEAVGGFDRFFESAPDYDLCLRLSEVTQFYHLAKPLYYYRQHAQQMTQSRRQELVQYSCLAMNRALQRRGLAERYVVEVKEATNKLHLRSRKHGADEGDAKPSPVKYQAVYNLTADNISAYDAFTFPSLQKRWQTRTKQGELVGISATISHQMVGMVIAEILPESQNPPSLSASIISCYVVPNHRHQSIGTTLIGNLEKELKKVSCQRVEISYKSSELTALALEPLLKNKGWLPPQTTFLLAQTTTQKIAEAPWLHKYPLPDSFTVFPWSELTAQERQAILQQGEYPNPLNPFSDESRIEPLNSLGLRHNGEVIGWMITHRVAPDTIRYSSLFVRKKYQKLGRGISLLAASIKLQIDSEIENGTFSVAADNEPMLSFLNRHLRPYLTGIGSSRIAVKLL